MTAAPNHIGADYVLPLLVTKKRRQIMRKTISGLKSFGLDKFDAIACRGVSGMVYASVVASRLDKDLIVVRKPADGTHSAYPVEGLSNCRYLILDDLMSSGKTIQAIVSAARDELSSICIGAYLWMDNRWILPGSQFWFRLGLKEKTEPKADFDDIKL